MHGLKTAHTNATQESGQVALMQYTRFDQYTGPLHAFVFSCGIKVEDARITAQLHKCCWLEETFLLDDWEKSVNSRQVSAEKKKMMILSAKTLHGPRMTGIYKCVCIQHQKYSEVICWADTFPFLTTWCQNSIFSSVPTPHVHSKQFSLWFHNWQLSHQ